MDESGCLGFDFSKKKTSKNFIITFLFVKKKRPLEKIVKKTFLALPKKTRQNHCGILHCVKEKPQTRIKLLTLLSKANEVSIMSIKLNKKKVYVTLQDEKPVLYNYVSNILLDRIFNKKLIPLNEPIKLIASRRETNKFLNKNFSDYLTKQTNANHSIPLDIQIIPAHGEKLLQVVDFVSWALYRNHEYNDNYYYDIIKKLILEENALF